MQISFCLSKGHKEARTLKNITWINHRDYCTVLIIEYINGYYKYFLYIKKMMMFSH